MVGALAVAPGLFTGPGDRVAEAAQYLASEPVRKWLAGKNMEIIRHLPSTSRPGGRAATGRRRPRA